MAGIDTISDADEPPLILGMLLGLRGECDVFNGDPASAVARTDAGLELGLPDVGEEPRPDGS